VSLILVVEDDVLLQEVLAERLRLRDYEVLVCGDGQHAIDTALVNMPDVILMDMHLPVLSGWEATQKLKSHPETKRIPVIALTAHSTFMLDDRQKSLDAGCDDHEPKPVNFDRLIRKIEQFIASQSAAE